jgi:exopolysaccharide biosynthesis polyprenyl glycosylphosphotransferase
MSINTYPSLLPAGWRWQKLLKRVLDYSFALIGLVLLSPFLCFIALLIRLDSPGAIFFRQLRIGLNQRPFYVWKFRTMVIDAEQQLKNLESHNESAGGVLFKMRNDPRITTIGQFLRRTSIDELPQLFNVLQGQMSLVGPRPLQLRDYELAVALNTEHVVHRQSILPGLTGIWQVSGRSEIGFEQMLRLDTQYLAEWSLWLDLQILWRTVLILFTAKGAY